MENLKSYKRDKRVTRREEEEYKKNKEKGGEKGV